MQYYCITFWQRCRGNAGSSPAGCHGKPGTCSLGGRTPRFLIRMKNKLYSVSFEKLGWCITVYRSTVQRLIKRHLLKQRLLPRRNGYDHFYFLFWEVIIFRSSLK